MKRFLVIILLFLPLIFVSAEEKKQDISNIRQVSIESLDITPNPVGLGDIFTMTVVVDYNNSSEVDFPMKNLPADLLLWRGPYIRSFLESDKEGNSTRKVQITTTFKARKSGRIIIPAMQVLVDGKVFYTDAVLLRVGLYKNRQLYMPIEAEWRSGFKKIYAGEAVPLSLMVLNQEIVAIFDRVRVAYPRDGFFEEAGGIAEIQSYTEGNITLYDIPAATYILTSPVSGDVSIPSAGVDYGGITGWTDNLILKINRIPAEITESGAIGNFSVKSSIDKQNASVGDNVILTVSVSGDGNLNYLKIPEPVVNGFFQGSADEINNFKAGPLGFSGTKTVQWIYTAETAGESDISLPSFRYLDKASDEIVSLPGRDYYFNITEAALDEADDEVLVFPFEKIEISPKSSPLWRNHYKSLFRYAWILPGFVFFIMSVIMKGRKLVLAAVLSVIIIIVVYSNGRFIIDAESSAEDVVSAEILYNRGIEFYSQGDLTDSIHYFRTAVYQDPGNKLYRETLNWIEHGNGFVNSVSPSIMMHPDTFYYILMVSLNLFFFAAVLRLVKPGGGVSVLTILFGMTILFSSLMIVYSHISREQMTAIVCSEGSSLKKIPRESAEDWVPMKAGTALKLIDKSDDFLLVETGLGVKGWIPETCIIRDR